MDPIMWSSDPPPPGPSEENMPGSCCPFCRRSRIKSEEKPEPEQCPEPNPELPQETHRPIRKRKAVCSKPLRFWRVFVILRHWPRAN